MGCAFFEFHADFAHTNLTTFLERPDSPVAVAAFNPNVSAIPQPGTLRHSTPLPTG